MKYFQNCTSEIEVKKEFKRLCLLMHPDTSGYDSHSDFLQMYDQCTNWYNNNNIVVEIPEYTAIDPTNGLPLESSRMTFLDFSDYDGEPNISLVTNRKYSC